MGAHCGALECLCSFSRGNTKLGSSLGETIWGSSPICTDILLYLHTQPPAKKYHGSWNHVGWKGSLEVIQSQLPAQGKIRLLRAYPAEFEGSREGECSATPGTTPVFGHRPIHINK